MMTLGCSYSFTHAAPPRADNENYSGYGCYPRRFTDYEIDEINSLFGKFQRLGKVKDWHTCCSRETSLFWASNSDDGRNNYMLNIRKFTKDGMFYYATSCKLTNEHFITPNFASVMQQARLTLEKAPQLSKAVIRLAFH